MPADKTPAQHGCAPRDGAPMTGDVAMRLLMDRSFILTILAVVVFATILAFGLGASAELICTILGLGVVTAVAENHFRSQRPT
ncbi:hypothetical protein ASC80_20155 [Afipia sp. Root123D2]|nr:hypothetical protein ASC80_20155 [Afipia sp. Root123D2]